jgi:two-component system, chemotaxis family, protein-glutamate methylesterase/glutaminase
MPFNLIVIGASTGGPRLLRDLFRSLPPLDAAVLIVQHMPKYINDSLRSALASLCAMPVKLAEDKEMMNHGMVYIAPSDKHLRLIRNKQIELYDAEKVNLSKPSIDVTMQSLKPDGETSIVGILFPGVGADGAEGIRHIRSIHGTTYAIEDPRKSLSETIETIQQEHLVDDVFTIWTAHETLLRSFHKGTVRKKNQPSDAKKHDGGAYVSSVPEIVSKTKEKLVIIGSSTGGPRILRRVLNNLPRLDLPIVIVQHMPKFINQSFQSTLDHLTEMNVKLAVDGETLTNGTIYIAPSDLHLTLKENNTIFKLVTGEKVNFCRPAIDVAMKSLQKAHHQTVIGVILTGMGRDGAEGLSHIKKEIQGITVSEDEESCIVYGMPKAAVETGDVDYVLTPEAIRETIIKFAR